MSSFINLAQLETDAAKVEKLLVEVVQIIESRGNVEIQFSAKQKNEIQRKLQDVSSVLSHYESKSVRDKLNHEGGKRDLSILQEASESVRRIQETYCLDPLTKLDFKEALSSESKLPLTQSAEAQLRRRVMEPLPVIPGALKRIERATALRESDVLGKIFMSQEEKYPGSSPIRRETIKRRSPLSPIKIKKEMSNISDDETLTDASSEGMSSPGSLSSGHSTPVSDSGSPSSVRKLRRNAISPLETFDFVDEEALAPSAEDTAKRYAGIGVEQVRVEI